MWVGLCLTRWGFVHEALYEICFSALNTTARNTAILFYKTPNFETRLSLTNELVEACFPSLKSGEHKCDALKEWDEITKGLLDLSPIRNALAHQNPSVTAAPETIILCADANGRPQGPAPFVDLSAGDGWMEVRLSRSEEIRGRKVKVSSVRDTELPRHYLALEGTLERLWAFNQTLRDHIKRQAKSVG
jgi:hypothetical protein